MSIADKINVLYIIPRYFTYGMSGHYVIPMGIMYVSSFVKQSGVANVFTVNLNHEQGSEEEILSRIIRLNKIDVAGVGGLSGEYRDLARIVKIIKEIDEKVITVLGGGIVTADPENTMRAFPEVDYGIIGEGEHTFVELLSSLQENKEPSGVCGLIYPVQDDFHKTPRREEIMDLDNIPFPDYEGFQFGEYLKENPDMSDEGMAYSRVSVIGGRSCKYNCTFCFHPSGSRYRQRSLDSIFSEIDYLIAHYPINYIALREELFATDNVRVREFCKRMEKYDFDWSIQLRIDSINQELVDILKGTRCRYVFVGVESAVDKVLKSMRKGITISQIETALDLLNETGIHSRSGVILGDTVETLETACQSLEWVKRNRNKYRLFVDMIIAFPGSILYKRAVRAGIIPDPVQFLKDGCPIVNLSKMSDDEFRSMVEMVEQMNGNHYNVKFYGS